MRRALCVGIDNYSFGPLHGCVNDAQRMSALLDKHEDGAPNFECRTVVAPQGGQNDAVIRKNLRQAIEKLFQDKAEVALFYFSGHGTENDLGGFLVTQDATKYDEGVAMTDVLTWANNSKAEEVVIILDCCHAGHLGNLPQIDNQKTLLREGVSILTASRGSQVSVEVGGGGVFTSLIVDALSGGAADILGKVAVPAIYGFAESALGAWDQRPLLKAHIAKMVPLRLCAPKVGIATLRELPTLFPVPAEDYALSPEFEQSNANADAGKVGILKKFQALNRVHLVVPVDAHHMYDAAMQSKSCRLTDAGRYYWRLAKDNRI